MSDICFDNLSDKETRYDEMFLSILQNEGKIEPFLDTVFRFLYRRTDFYLIQETADQPFGFPVNVAKQIVNKIFSKYDSIPKDRLKQRLLETNHDLSNKIQQKKEKPKSSNTQNAPAIVNKPVENKIDIKQQEPSSPKSEGNLKKNQELFQKDPSSYNGAIRENYSWTQSIKDVDVRVKINSTIKTSKDVKVKIDKELLQVSVKNESNSWTYLINDNLAWKVKPDECTWSLFPSDHIHIYLEKIQERWWENLLKNEDKIDLKNITPEKPIEELDQESQAKIKQMMYDEQQKRLGLPTSDEQRKIDILAKAWNAEGSPFKGTPFDPSVLQQNK